MNILAGTKEDGTIVRVKCDDNGNLITNYALEDGGNLENINDNVKSINAITDAENGYSSILLENGSAVYADSVPTPIVDSNKRAGWYYINVEAGNKCNYYFLDGTQETFTLANLVYMYAKISIDNFANDVQNLPFLTVYTKATGSGDAGAFYHSKITYTMTNNTQKIGVGEEVFFFAKAIPTNQWFKNRIIRDDEIIIVGEALPTEEILFMSLGTDSGASPLGVRLLVQELGFSMGQVNRKVSLVGYNGNDVIPSKIDETNGKIDETNGKLDTINTTITDKHLNSGTDSVSVNLITGFALEEGGNLESIKNKTDTLTFHNHNSIDRLYTYDDIQNTKLDTSNSNTSNLNNMVFGGGNTILPLTSTLQNNLVMGYRATGGGSPDIHALCVNQNGAMCCNITSIEATETLNVKVITTYVNGSFFQNLFIPYNTRTPAYDISNYNLLSLLYSDNSTGAYDSIYLEISIDGVNYYQYYSLYPNNDGTKRTGMQIELKVGGFNYIRFWNRYYTGGFSGASMEYTATT